MKINFEDIFDLELELTGTCNLSCPLCARNNLNIDKKIYLKNIRPLKEIKLQLDKFINLKNLCLAGIVSEPTLYPELIELLDYLENRQIKTELYTNGNTKTDEWWLMLSKKYYKNIQIIFTVCGSTQQMHSTYRVGSNLDEIYKRINYFKQNNKYYENIFLQIIKFNYNEKDILQNYSKIIRDIPNCQIKLIDSLPYNERFNFNSEIKMTENLTKKYELVLSLIKNKKLNINCKSLNTKFLSIDQYGNITPCFLYRYSSEKFDMDFTQILKGKYDFCFECDTKCEALLKTFNIDQMA